MMIKCRTREGEDELTAGMIYANNCRFVNSFFTLIAESLPDYFDTSIFDDDFPFA